MGLVRRDFIAAGFTDRANHPMLLRELEAAIPLAARHGVPNLIAMFGNRQGKSDAVAIDTCVAGLKSRTSSCPPATRCARCGKR